jgi:hypothetical protein
MTAWPVHVRTPGRAPPAGRPADCPGCPGSGSGCPPPPSGTGRRAPGPRSAAGWSRPPPSDRWTNPSTPTSVVSAPAHHPQEPLVQRIVPDQPAQRALARQDGGAQRVQARQRPSIRSYMVGSRISRAWYRPRGSPCSAARPAPRRHHHPLVQPIVRQQRPTVPSPRASRPVVVLRSTAMDCTSSSVRAAVSSTCSMSSAGSAGSRPPPRAWAARGARAMSM